MALNKRNEDYFLQWSESNGVDCESLLGRKFKACWEAARDCNSLDNAALSTTLTVRGLMELVSQYGAQLRVDGVGPDVQRAYARVRAAVLSFVKED